MRYRECPVRDRRGADADPGFIDTKLDGLQKFIEREVAPQPPKRTFRGGEYIGNSQTPKPIRQVGSASLNHPRNEVPSTYRLAAGIRAR